MQALILAAGMGRRLGSLTQDKTKAMIEINGRTLIERMLEAIAAAGIRRAIIVTGHGAASLRAFVDSHRGSLDVTFVDNPLFETTNNIYSLWLARSYLEADDTLLLESDVIFEPGILREIVDSPAPNLAVVARFEPWMDGTVTVLDDDGNIVDIVPKTLFKWAEADSYYKTANIYKFSSDFSKQFYLPFLNAYITSFGRSKYYEQALTVITYLNKTELRAFRMGTRKWYEIDDANDLAVAETLFADPDRALTQYQKRYGGYWRFPRLRDFCYLVNPYFPSPRMLDELQRSARGLLTSYPSGLDVQNALAAALFDCDPAHVLVGNGASELVRIALSRIEGEIGVVVPTFEEYLRTGPGGGRVRQFRPRDADFGYSVEELEDFAAGLGLLVLVNPDNPTGHCIAQRDRLALIEHLSRKGVRLLLDESFVDFADEGVGGSMLNAELLRRYPSVMVVRSISKSYGVPGLRLGVLGSADRELLSGIRTELPVWNINSIGEFFLQIIGKYRNEYADACARLRQERAKFERGLKQFGFLRVVNSQANYFLCELGGLKATALAQTLLDQHAVLIKDCTGKRGLEGGEYVRIAVRDTSDNDFLLAALGTIHG
jgi:histidinol-phosphate/aromatic aminotransferase/cobyric acid decarboxylase-like protein/choline kinase